MVAGTRCCAPPAPRRGRFEFPLTAAAVGLLLGLLCVPLAAQEAPGGDGLYITVLTPISDKVIDDIEKKVKDAVGRPRRKGTTRIIFNFNPDGQKAATSNVNACNRLRVYIRDLRQGNFKSYPQVTTVAYLQDEVSGHTVLPVLACNEIVMSSRAKLGQVLRDDEALEPSARTAYEEVARHWPSPDLVWKMIFPDLVVRKVQTEDGVRYVSEQTIERMKKKGERVAVLGGVPPGLEAGRANTVFDSARAREYGLCKAVYNTPGDVVQAYGLPRHTLTEDWFVGRTPVAWRIDLRGTVNKARLDSLERRVKAAVGRGANIIILNLDCEGGETVDVASTARFLQTLRDDSGALKVKTIAYVPARRALGAATYLAVGCNEIVMASTAVLGDFEYLKARSGDNLKAQRDMLLDLAEKGNYLAHQRLLLQATLQPDLDLYRARHRLDPGHFTVLSGQQLKADAAAGKPQWEQVGRVAVAPGELLKIDANLAGEWGLARYNDVETPEALYARYNLEASRVRVSRDDWLDKVAEFFRQELVKVFLIMIGVAGLILELKMPGVGLPGIVAALCFVLFFWAHSFVGEFTMLAILLFLLGLVLIGLEIFVLPGFGITGISGVALVVASLVLVTLERMPETTQDWVSLGATITTFGIGLVAAIAGACVLAWYLPQIPYASRLVLQPPAESAEAERDAEQASAAAALLGAIGVAATTLRPAGKARFGEEYLDVIAEGDYVNAGSRVQVIEIEGNRIVVKEV